MGKRSERRQARKDELVTVAVLVYNNSQYLKDCLQSIFDLDYDNIQLIINDDGSEHFDTAAIDDFIRKNKTANIREFAIHVMPRNVGTVKSFNYVLSAAKGEYIKYIAADDLFYDETALRELVKAAERERADVVIARAPNYDCYLEQQIGVYPSDYHWDLMFSNRYDAKTFFGIMSEYCLISSPACLYKKSFLIEYGGADERYRIIEDWPMWMRMLRAGKSFAFLNKNVVIYRSGGVSNGKDNPVYARHQIEYADVIKYECLPFPEAMATREQYKLAKKSERKHRYDGERILLKDAPFSKKLLMYCHFWDVLAAKLFSKIGQLYCMFDQKKKRLLVGGVIVMLCLLLADLPTSVAVLTGSQFVKFASVISKWCVVVTMAFLSCVLVLYFFTILVKVILTIKWRE